MDIFGGLNKLSGNKFLAYLFTSLSLIIPGAGYIYLTNLSLFQSIETIKLLFLSIFFSLPIFLIGLLMEAIEIYVEKEKKQPTKDFGFGMAFGASSFTLISFFGAILLYFIESYLSEWLQPFEMPLILYIYLVPLIVSMVIGGILLSKK